MRPEPPDLFRPPPTRLRELRAFAADVLAFARWRAALAFGLVAVGGAIEGFSLVLLIPLIQLMIGEPAPAFAPLIAAIDAVAGPEPSVRIGLILALFAAAMLLRTLLLGWRQTVVAALEVEYLVGKQRQMIGALVAAPWSRLSGLRHARISHLLSNDVYRVGDAATGLIESLVAAITLAVQLAIAVMIEPRLTLLAALFVGTGSLLSLPMIRAAREVGEAVTGANLSLLNDTGQFLGALKLAVSQNLEGGFVRGFGATLDAAAGEELRYVARANRNRLRMTLIALAVVIGTVYLGFARFGVPAATLIALLALLSRMSAPIGQLQAQASEMIRALPAYQQMVALHAELASEARVVDAHAPAPRGEIRFENVGYAHAGVDGGGGVRGFDLAIAPGAFLGIVGGSGAGKTTFADLLVGLYAPQEGRITVGGSPVALPALPAWRGRLAYVSQDSFMTHDSVRANLLWARPDAADAAIARALALSGGDAVVATLPDGLDTIVGERGGLISGGERQRLALARALLRDPALLILDEATNAIDIQTERAILQRLDRLRPRTTIVMIAHRLESLACCSAIAVVAQGRVTATGTPAELHDILRGIEAAA